MARADRFVAFADDDENDRPDRAGIEEDDDDFDEGDEDLDDDDVDSEAQDFYSEFQRPLSVDDTVAILAKAQGESSSWYRGGQVLMPTTEMVCRVCGCSESRACAGGCFWAAPNLCSRCVA